MSTSRVSPLRRCLPLAAACAACLTLTARADALRVLNTSKIVYEYDDETLAFLGTFNPGFGYGVLSSCGTMSDGGMGIIGSIEYIEKIYLYNPDHSLRLEMNQAPYGSFTVIRGMPNDGFACLNWSHYGGQICGVHIFNADGVRTFICPLNNPISSNIFTMGTRTDGKVVVGNSSSCTISVFTVGNITPYEFAPGYKPGSISALPDGGYVVQKAYSSLLYLYDKHNVLTGTIDASAYVNDYPRFVAGLSNGNIAFLDYHPMYSNCDVSVFEPDGDYVATIYPGGTPVDMDGGCVVAGPVETTSPAGWLRAGWNLVSLPYAPVDPDPEVVFDDLTPPNVIDTSLFKYSPGTGYQMYSADFTEVESKVGYWLRLDAAGDATYEGWPFGPGETVGLEQGWNLIGVPCDTDAAAADVQVTDGVDTYSLEDAMAAGWLQLPAFYYETGVGYRTIGPSGEQDDHFRLWHGYWLLVLQPGLQLVMP